MKKQNSNNLTQVGIHDLYCRKEELEVEYQNFLEFYTKQKENFQKISNNQMNNYAELFNFINDLFSDKGNEEENLLLQLLENQHNLIHELSIYFATPHWQEKNPSLIPPSIENSNILERQDSLIKKEIHMELQGKLIDKFADKIQKQDNLIKMLTNENLNLRNNLETLLRKSLIRNLPHHFGKKFYSATGVSSNYNSHINVSNLNYNNFHTNITHGNLNTRGNNLANSASSNMFYDINYNHSPEMKNEINSYSGANIKERKLTLKINEYIENAAGKRINKNENKRSDGKHVEFDNEIESLFGQITKLGELINTSKHHGRSFSPGLQNSTIVENINDKNEDQNSEEIINYKYSRFKNKSEEKILIPYSSRRLPLKKKNILYDTNIISSKGIKDYIKSSRNKNEDDNIINVPMRKFVMNKISKNNKMKDKIKSANQSFNQNSQPDGIIKKTLLVNRNRDLKRGSYGKNVALIRENANKFINYDQEIDNTERQNKDENKDNILNINININKDSTMIQLKPTNKKTIQSVGKKKKKKMTRLQKNNSCDIDIFEYPNIKKSS